MKIKVPVWLAKRTVKLVVWLTHRLWNKLISRILNQAYHDGVIDSKQLHELAARFDPTQDHAINKTIDQAYWRPK